MKYNYYKISMRSEKHITSIKRRIHTQSEDNIRVSERLSLAIKRTRLNTINSQQGFVNEKLTLARSATKAKLSPIKHYETRLSISSETWSAHSFKEKKYKRGWKPTKVVQFSCFLRILLIRVWYDLKYKYPTIQKVWVRTNRYILSSQQKKRALPIFQQLKLKQLEIRQPSGYKLAQNTFIQLKDLLTANLYQNREQINEYAVAFLGMLLEDINEGIIPNAENLYYFKQPLEHQVSPDGLNEVVLLVISYVNDYLKNNSFNMSSVSSKFQLWTSPQEMARIYSDLLERYPQYLKLISRRELQISIKYQMGYRFYQERKIKFAQDWTCLQDHILLRYRGKYNYAVISFNKHTENIIVLYDCKFSMQDADIRKIQQFIFTMSKPIVAKKNTLLKLPLLKLTE